MKRIVFLILLSFVMVAQTFAADIKYTYDALNRLVQVVYSNGTTVTYTYDAVGNRTSKKTTCVPPLKMGDANGDGTVDAKDIVAIVDYQMGKPSADFYMSAADINKDGKVTIADIIQIANTIISTK